MIPALVLSPFTQQGAERLGAVSGYQILYGGSNPTEEQLEEAEVILGQPSWKQLSQAKNLKWVQIAYAGVDGYARELARFPQGVTLTNVTGAFGDCIGEYVLTMVMMLMKRMPQYAVQQQAQLWQDAGAEQSPAGKTLLILGAGDIGSATARLFRPFGCRIVGVRRVPRQCPPEFDEMHTLEEVEQLLPQADILVSALPSTPATRGLLHEKRLGLLKPSAVLVNVGRGDLIDCAALARQLEEGKLFGAALDVTSPEPLPQDHPLWHAPNTIITPHITGSSFGHLPETTEKIYKICLQNMARYRDGQPLNNVVDLTVGYRLCDQPGS
jgi:phosphoglycerate dehydrogenase-like enzyme